MTPSPQLPSSRLIASLEREIHGNHNLIAMARNVADPKERELILSKIEAHIARTQEILARATNTQNSNPC